jgi:glycosyltransferase involved in cell wall biosynthesis
MRVVTLTGSFCRGHGIDTSISYTLSRIHYKHSDLELELCCNEIDELVQDGFPKEIPITMAKKPKLCGYTHLSAFWLRNYFQGDEDVVIHVHHPIATWPLIGKKGKKMVTWHGNTKELWNDPDFGSLPKRIARRVVLDFSVHMFRTLDKVVTVSDYLRRQLGHDFGISEKNVERIYWGVDTSRFQRSDEDHEYMLFVGRHVGYKNIDVLIELSSDLNFPLVLVGDGRHRPRLEALANKLNAPVRFTGIIPLDELVDVYQKCSFYVTASKWEGFGLPPIEAAACGKPVLVPYNSAQVELVDDLSTGVVYNDLFGLRSSAMSLIKDPVRRMDYGLAARAMAVERFNLDNTADAYADIYRRLAD